MNTETLNRPLRIALALVIFGWASAVVPLGARGASFDCERAATEVEKLICSDTGLSELDDLLAEEYRQALARSGNSKNLILAQRAWLFQRNACADEACLGSKYLSRIVLLQATGGHVNCDPAVGMVHIEHCPGVNLGATPDQLRTTYCMVGPSGAYLRGSPCRSDVTDYLLARTRVIRGDPAFCSALLSAEYSLIDLNLPHFVSQEDAAKYLNLSGGMTHVHPLAGHFDVNNDGKLESIGWIKAYSGAGRGCDVERFVQLSLDRTRIADTKLTALLGSAGCSDYWRAFRYQGKTYLENRRTLRYGPHDIVDVLKEVIALEGNSRRVVCRYAYEDR